MLRRIVLGFHLLGNTGSYVEIYQRQSQAYLYRSTGKRNLSEHP
jgi:hypothetical protein|eukprot:COSAG06_NODE_182_length_20899_cov_89.175048_7_plen_44_part_00